MPTNFSSKLICDFFIWGWHIVAFVYLDYYMKWEVNVENKHAMVHALGWRIVVNPFHNVQSNFIWIVYLQTWKSWGWNHCVHTWVHFFRTTFFLKFQETTIRKNEPSKLLFHKHNENGSTLLGFQLPMYIGVLFIFL